MLENLAASLVVLAVAVSVSACSSGASDDVRHVVTVGDQRLVDMGDGCLELVGDHGPGGTCWEPPDNALHVLARPSGGENRQMLVVVAVTVPDVASVELRQDGGTTAGEARDYSGEGQLFTLVVPVGTQGHIVALDAAGRTVASTEALHLRRGGTFATTVYPDL